MFKEVAIVIVCIVLISIPLSIVFEEYSISNFLFSMIVINVPIALLLIFLALDGYRSVTDFYKYV